MYATIYIRLNIIFAIKRLSQYFVDLIKYYDVALKTLLYYLRFIVNRELTFINSENSYFIIYFDLDYVVDKLNKKIIFECYL